MAIMLLAKLEQCRIVENGGYNSQNTEEPVRFVSSKNPKLLVGVSTNNPEGANYYAGKIAAPVFSEVVSEVFRYMQVPTKIRVIN